MKEKDVKLNNERKTFSKKFKREILLEVIKGKSAKNALFDSFSQLTQENTKDKKYAPKLLYKWKKEFYSNIESLFLLNHEIDEKMIKSEIASLGNEEEEEEINIDFALKELKSKFLKIIK